jgi:hypothetical protein
MHQNLVLDAARRERRELRALAGLEALDRLDQPDRADADKVLEIFPGVVEFFDDMDTTRCRLPVFRIPIAAMPPRIITIPGLIVTFNKAFI